METMTLRREASIDRHAYVRLIREVFARSPLFRQAAVSEPVGIRDGEVALNVSLDDGPTVCRVVAENEDEAYAILHALALAMVELEERHVAPR